MRERPQASAVARRVSVEAYPSPGKGDADDGYYRQQQRQRPQPERPHSFIGFSRADSYGDGLDFYSSKYNRGLNRNTSYGNTTGRSGALGRGVLRPNKSSNDLLTADSGDLCPVPSLYRDLFNGSPSPSIFRDFINQSPAPGYGGRLNSGEVSPLRSQSVLSNRSYLNSKNNRDIASNLNSDSVPDKNSITTKRNLYNTRFYNPQASNNSNNSSGNKHLDESSLGLNAEKQRRKSSNGVTFALPEDENSSDEQASVYGQFSISAAAYRRMSAPELPPINTDHSKKGGNSKTPRGDKRKTSVNSVHSTGTKASINQLAAAVNSKTFYNRKVSTTSVEGGTATVTKRGKKKKLPIPRNHSDSSLKNLVASSQSQESGSTVNSYPTATAEGGGSRSSGGGGGGSGGGGGPRQVKYLANGHRALSWCATENSGSQTKLETLFEGQNANGNASVANNNNNNNNNTIFNNNNIIASSTYTYSPLGNPIHKTNSSNSISNLVNNNKDIDMPSIIGPRSVSVNGIRNKEDALRLAVLNKTLMSENGDGEIETVDEFANRGRMRRSNSENKLGVKSNRSNSNVGHSKQPQKQTHRSLSRNLSVDRIDKLTSNSKPQRKNMTSAKPNHGANSKMRRVSSMANLPNKTNRDALNDVINQDEVFDDEESVEASTRLVEWLNVVNNVEEYDTDPKDQVVDYPDEPPQTDTALHLVYEGE